MAPALGGGPVHHADETLEVAVAEALAQFVALALAQVEEARHHARIMELAFAALRQRWIPRHDLHGRIPVARRGDGACMRAEADRHRARAVFLPAQLADV